METRCTIAGEAPVLAESLPVCVVEAVADHADVDVVDLPPLFEAVDPDALSALVTDVDPDERVRVEFDYVGRTVTVEAAGDREPTIVIR